MCLPRRRRTGCLTTRWSTCPSPVSYTHLLSDILVSWVKRHAKNGKYHTQGRTSTLLAFSDIFVDNSMEDGMQSDVNDFALALYQYLKGLNLSVSRTITGNSIDVIIY